MKEDEIRISVFKRADDPNPHEEITLHEAANRFKMGYYKQTIDKFLLKYNDESDKEKKKKLKIANPAFTWGGLFSSRKNDQLIKGSQAACFDIDDISDSEFVKQHIFNNYPECWMATLSLRKTGVKVVFRIPEVKSDAEYKEYYFSIAQALSDVVSLDNTPDIARLCFVCDDPNLLVREWSKTSIWEDRAINGIKNTADNYLDEPIKYCYFNGNPDDAYKLTRGMIIRAKDGNKHYALLKAARLMGGLLGAGYLDEEKVIKHLEKEILSRKPDSFEGAQKTIRSGIEYGKRSPLTINKPIMQVESFLRNKYDLRRNIVTGTIEDLRDGSPKEVNEDDIYIELLRYNIKFTQTNLMSLLNSRFVPEYDPILAYFESLKFDGTTDYIGKLASFVEVKGDPTFFQNMFKKHLVRTVAQGLRKTINRTVFVLKSNAQENGKSTFIRFLNPFPDGKYLTEEPVNDGKDSRIALARNLIWNLEELASLDKKDVDKLKAFISSGDVNERIPYDRRSTIQPRCCSFFASTNKDEFLVDDRNTRWLIFDIKEINFDYHNTTTPDSPRLVNIHNVWAQAYHLFKNGYNYNLTKDEATRRDMLNLSYLVSTNEHNLICRYFAPRTKNDDNSIFLTATDILNYLGEIVNHQVKMSTVGIGRALAQIGYERIVERDKKNPKRGYYVEIVEDDYKEIMQRIKDKSKKYENQY